ncbi:MAG TPA: pyruvate dehydrogenase (acetyl-transferring) E1 component subunit alpha [Thermoleophilia bacterium]|nr:pyruvate dehydrogenase (acetyl-transferring) E1 component subunit alpha [Thermoleophilia bacterium]
MPVTTLAQFSIERVEVMDQEGNVDESLMPDLSEEQIRHLYETMVLTRQFDERMLKLQRQGRLGTFARVMGQEAAHIGTTYALEKGKDWLVPAFRETGAFILWGTPLESMLAVNAGDERGQKIDEGVRVLPVSVPIATHLLHATGIAWAMKQKGEDSIALTVFGDGATSEGDFSEAMNFGGVFKLPMIFLCQNNQWAISVPYYKQTAAATVAQKAIAYGMPGVQVDGNDIFAVYRVAKEAADRARGGGGPTLIEAHTYRLSDHTTSDDARRYRTVEDLDPWLEKDPIPRLARYMQKQGMLDDDGVVQVREQAIQKVADAVKAFEEIEPADPERIFDNVFAERTPNLEEQLRWLKFRTGEGR